MAGNFAQNVSITMGTNADEGSEFADIDYDADEQAYEDYLYEVFEPELAALTLLEYPYAAYNGSADGKVPGHGGYWAAVRVIGDGIMSCPARRAVRAFSSVQPSTYLYFFNHTPALLYLLPPSLGDDPDELGSFHGSELPFVFDFKVGLVNADEDALALEMVSFWSFFAASKNPNTAHQTVPLWPAYTDVDDEAMVLATPEVYPMSNLKHDKCDFWDANPLPVDVIFGPPPI